MNRNPVTVPRKRTKSLFVCAQEVGVKSSRKEIDLCSNSSSDESLCSCSAVDSEVPSLCSEYYKGLVRGTEHADVQKHTENQTPEIQQFHQDTAYGTDNQVIGSFKANNTLVMTQTHTRPLEQLSFPCTYEEFLEF